MYVPITWTSITQDQAISYQSIDADELLWTFCPRRQLHIRDHGAVLHYSQIVVVGVDKHLRKIVELWDQLLNESITIYTVKLHFMKKQQAINDGVN